MPSDFILVFFFFLKLPLKNLSTSDERRCRTSDKFMSYIECRKYILSKNTGVNSAEARSHTHPQISLLNIITN